MEIIFILAIIFGGSILALVIVGSTLLMAIKILKGGLSRKGEESLAEETRVIQSIYQGLVRLEERVGDLETIIMDHERKGRLG